MLIFIIYSDSFTPTEKKNKRRRNAISLDKKLAILDYLANGQNPTEISKFLNLGESTIRAIKKNEVAIRKSVINGTKLSSNLTSYSRDPLLEKTEKALVIWIEDLSQKRFPICGYLIKEKALLFHKLIKQQAEFTSPYNAKVFTASKGWLTGFLKRYSFHNIKIKGETASAYEGAASIYSKKFIKMIEDGCYSPDQVFNADETELFWKKMPSRTYIAMAEKKASGFKAFKDRISMLFCSNASGDRMLKPLMINRSQRPRALKGKNLKQLPVHWMANTKAWVTTAVFTEWFYDCFVPEVESYLRQKNLDFKALLIIDNAPGHPYLEHPNVKIVFLPPNTTCLIQPLDQGIISTFKYYYIKITYQHILDKLENGALTVPEVWKKFSILDCIHNVSRAVSQITPHTLNSSWKAVWPECVTDGEIINTSTLSSEIITLANQLGGEGFDTFSQNDVDELLEDTPLNDDDILSLILHSSVDIEDDIEVEVPPPPLTVKIIQEASELCNKLENLFIVHDSNSERAFKFQRELKNCMSPYHELRKKLLLKSSQSLITD